MERILTILTTARRWFGIEQPRDTLDESRREFDIHPNDSRPVRPGESREVATFLSQRNADDNFRFLAYQRARQTEMERVQRNEIVLYSPRLYIPMSEEFQQHSKIDENGDRFMGAEFHYYPEEILPEADPNYNLHALCLISGVEFVKMFHRIIIRICTYKPNPYISGDLIGGSINRMHQLREVVYCGGEEAISLLLLVEKEWKVDLGVSFTIASTDFDEQCLLFNALGDREMFDFLMERTDISTIPESIFDHMIRAAFLWDKHYMLRCLLSSRRWDHCLFLSEIDKYAPKHLYTIDTLATLLTLHEMGYNAFLRALPLSVITSLPEQNMVDWWALYLELGYKPRDPPLDPTSDGDRFMVNFIISVANRNIYEQKIRFKFPDIIKETYPKLSKDDIGFLRSMGIRELPSEFDWLSTDSHPDSLVLPPSAFEADFPQEFTDPISHSLMTNPVIDCFGFTYERASIESWLRSGNHTCPITNDPYPTGEVQLFPNRVVRDQISTWAQQFV